MKQSVMYFATAAARDSAITAPEEGMFAYLADSNTLTFYTGAAWATLALQLSLADAKGDIFVATAADAITRLAVGTDGQVFTADSTQATGTKWATVATTDRSVISGFSQTNVAGTGGPTQLTRQWNAGAIAAPITLDRPGSFVGISVAAADARTAGTCTVEIYKNGTGTGLTAVLDGTNTQYAYGTQALGVDTFVAGDRLDVRYTTSGFTPTSIDFECVVTVQFD